MIDGEISKARTLNPDHYYSEDLYKEHIDKLFSNSWQWLSHKYVFRNAVSAQPVTLLPGSLEEPLLLTRGKDGVTSCLSNVCTHRGACLLEKGKKTDSLKCPYHGRRFDLSGKMEHMPGFQGVEDFPSESDNLHKWELKSFGGHFFTQTGEADSFWNWLGPLKSLFDSTLLEKFQFDPGRSKEFEVPANWILYCENYLEGFHIPFIHKNTLGPEIPLNHYSYDLWEHGVLQKAESMKTEHSIQYLLAETGMNNRFSALYFWLFPNFMFNFYPWGLSLNIVLPHGPEVSRVKFLSYVFSPELLETGPGSALTEVEIEDEEILKSVQKGVKSRYYKGGRYSVKYERGVHHFHRMLLDQLNEK